MADVPSIPRVYCDNCGVTVDKVKHAFEFKKPREWGSCKIEGSRSVDSYGGKAELKFTDLCPECASAALDAAASALKSLRAEA